MMGTEGPVNQDMSPQEPREDRSTYAIEAWWGVSFCPEMEVLTALPWMKGKHQSPEAGGFRLSMLG